MSCYEWERGTITLPVVEVTKLKRSLVDTQNKLHEKTLDICLKFWDTVQKSGTDYATALHNWNLSMVLGSADETYTAAYWLLSDAGEGKPRKVTRVDVDQHFPRVNTRSNKFRAGSGTIEFDGRMVSWDVPENNHACEHARGSVMGRVFFAGLDGIKWVRGSGGKIIGNDEYNRDNSYEGGGGNYVKDEWPRPHTQLLGRNGVNGYVSIR